MTTKSRLEVLRERKEQIEKQLKAIEAREKEKSRKEDTRLKVLIGAGVLADSKINPSTELFLREILKRSIIATHDRKFLQSMGWLEDAPGDTENAETPGQ